MPCDRCMPSLSYFGSLLLYTPRRCTLKHPEHRLDALQLYQHLRNRNVKAIKSEEVLFLSIRSNPVEHFPA